jgi:carbohydrate diacid regulator
MVEHGRTPILTTELAQEIATETGRIVGFHILITDRDAIVIGSGDPSRLGSVHEASREVLRTQTPAWHTAEQASRLEGVRPGITLPLVIDGTSIGTVAITGSPRRVRQFGQVVQRQTEILLQQEALTRSRMLRERAVQDLLRDIVFFDAEVMEPETLALRGLELGFHPDLPRVVVLVDHGPTPEAHELSRPPRPLRTVREVFGAPQDLVAELTTSRIVVLHHVAREDRETDTAESLTQRAEDLVTRLVQQDQQDKMSAHVGIGTVTSSLRGLRDSYQDAAAALRIGPQTSTAGAVFAIEGMRLHQLLEASGHHTRDRFRTLALGCLPAQPDWLALRATLIAWAEGGFNLIRASELLHIHRNTLLYRLDKITRLAGRQIRDPREGINLYLACLIDQIDDSHR